MTRAPKRREISKVQRCRSTQAGGSLSRRLGPALPDDVTQIRLDQADAEFQSYVYFFNVR